MIETCTIHYQEKGVKEITSPQKKCKRLKQTHLQFTGIYEGGDNIAQSDLQDSVIIAILDKSNFSLFLKLISWPSQSGGIT